MNHLPSHVRIKCSVCKMMILKDSMKKHREEHNTIEQFQKEVNKAKIKKQVSKTEQAGNKNPWASFCSMQRPFGKSDNPLYTSEQVRTELQRQWRRLSDEEKAGYKNLEDEEDDEDEALEDGDEAAEHVQVLA